MAFQEVPQIVQVQAFFNGVGQLLNSEAQWSLYVHTAITPTQAQVDELRDVLVTFLTDDFSDITSEDWHATKATAKSLHEEGAPFAESDVDIPGLLTGDPAPAMTAMYFKFRGGSGGEPLRGGCFWNVGNEAAIDGNNWLSTFRTTCAGKMDILIAALDGFDAGATHRIVSRYKSTNDDVKDARAALRLAIQNTRRAEGVSNEVDSYTLRHALASQRDRRGD